MERTFQTGFTMIELLVAVAVAAILLGVGVPSFVEIVREGRVSSQYTGLVGALYLARSEAIKGSDDVVVCARASDTSCSNDPADWKNGWIVYADGAPLDAAGSAQIDAGDEILKVVPALAGDNYIIARGSDDFSAAGATERHFVRYGADGTASWRAGTFELCDAQDGAARSRAINIVPTGDIRRGSESGGDAPLDVFGSAIDCG